MTLDGLPDPRALLFDLDGTLVDTVPVRIAAWLAAFDEVGLRADRARVAGLIGSDGRELARTIAARAGRRLDEEEVERLDRRAGELHEAANVDPRPLPGARELLLGLTGSPISWAIATSSRRAQVRTSVEALHLPRRPTIVDGSHVRQAKPAPDLLLLAARRLHVPPAACWYVGDARWDMLAAVAAGMVPLAVTSGAADARSLRRAGAAAVVPDLTPITADLRRRGALA
ncbi:MAG TPA: HAD family phosphatase [Candidatus Sulfotelmatobacter sp.]|nr:HAD family phosphatase [Candidatus Sulfotelmatobacter sp.]